MNAPFFVHELRPAPADGRDAAPGPTAALKVPASLASAVLIVMLCVFGVLHIMNPMTLPIRNVEINGQFTHLAPASLQVVAEDVVRGGFFNVNVETVREAILREPWVRTVTVRRVWPQSLSLQVEEQVAVARWGDSGLLNAAGEAFRPDPATFPEGLPVLAGPDGTEAMLLDRYHFLRDLFAPVGLVVETLTLSERRAWRLRLAEGQEVVLGRTQFVERSQRFLDAAGGELADRLESIRVVDMRYTNGFAVQWVADAKPSLEKGKDGQEN